MLNYRRIPDRPSTPTVWAACGSPRALARNDGHPYLSLARPRRVAARGDQYILQDWDRPTHVYNGVRVENTVPLTHGGRIQIGETEIVFSDRAGELAGATIEEVDDPAPLPEATIAFDSGHRTTSGLLEAIEGARTQSSGGYLARQAVLQQPQQPATADQGDLLALISKVGVTLLASATRTLGSVARLSSKPSRRSDHPVRRTTASLRRGSRSA